MRCSILTLVSAATVSLVGAAVLPRAAQAQARGTLEATATVVDTRASFASLEAARGAVQFALAPRVETQRAAATVAVVSVTRPERRPTTLVVTIDYSRN